MIKRYLTGLFILLVTHVQAQQKEYRVISFSSRDGLASNSVNAIIKDHDGFMWFASDNGVNRFDGQQFTTYRHKENDSTSIGTGPVTTMTLDHTGRIWLATNSTLSVYNRNQDAFHNYNLSSIGWIRSLYTDHRGRIWLGTYSGLYIFDPNTRRAKRLTMPASVLSQPKSEIITCIFEDSQKNIWLGTEDGLFLFSEKKRLLKKIMHVTNHSQKGFDDAVGSVAEDSKGHLWIGYSRSGLGVFDIKTMKFQDDQGAKSISTSLSGKFIYKTVFDKTGALWVCSDGGVGVYDTQSGAPVTIKSSLIEQNGFTPSTEMRAARYIFIDDTGICWVAIHQAGINKLDPNLAYFSHKPFRRFDPNGLTSSSVMAFAESPAGSVFIGLEGAGLNVLNRKTDVIRPFDLGSKKANSTSVISLASAGNMVWAGTYEAGLYRINTVNGSIRYFHLAKSKTDPSDVLVNCIKVGSDGKIWLGTNGAGMYWYNPQDDSIHEADSILHLKTGQHLPLNGFITAIEEDKYGNIWIGSNGSGLAVYHPGNQSFQVLNHGNSGLPIDIVQSIYCDRKSRIWVGTLGGGLSLYQPENKSFVQYAEKHALSNDVVYSILEDKGGKLWISTNKGISCFDPVKQRFRNYSHYNGVQQSTFNVGASLVAANGEMYFGGLHGYNHFDPSNFFLKRDVPPLVFTTLRINNKPVTPSDESEITEHISVAKEITLSYKQNFSLDFMALNYSVPNENRYSYKLEGFDTEWNDVGTLNTASYTNLDPGKYLFRLKVDSEDGSWQSTEKTIKVIVNPPFWRTYYAYFAYVVLILLGIWGIRRMSVQKLKVEFSREQEKLEVKHVVEKERHDVERKMELEKVKVKFLTNLSHELKTPLTLVLNPIENLMAQEKSKEKLELLNLMNRNGKRLLNLVNQLLDFRSIEANELNLNRSEEDLIYFVREIADSFAYISKRRNIHLHFVSTFTVYHCSFDKDKLERIVINLLSNAIKFTNEGGNISVQIAGDGDSGIKLIIRDTGVGLPAELSSKIFDRFFQANNQSDTLNQGTGIGLSIAHEFVRLHGGSIKVESEEGVGSAFIVSLPLLPISSQPSQSELVESIPEKTKKVVKTNQPVIDLPVILIVDDDHDLRTYLAESLKNKYKVIEAVDGHQGWQKTLSCHPQLVVTDVNMPGMDGREMLQKIRNDTRTKHIPVIMLTVLSDELDQMEGLQAGASDYLTKPFSFHLLGIKIENSLAINNLLKDTYSKHIRIETPEVEIMSEDEKFLLRFSSYVEEHIEDPELSVEELSKAMFVSRGTLNNKILSLTGEAPAEYVRSLRLKKALSLL